MTSPDGYPITVRSPLLYHGTRYIDEVRQSGVLAVPTTGDQHVSLTTSFRVALYWAMMPRGNPGAETPGVVVFHRRHLLEAGYDLFAFDGTGHDDEAEMACPQAIALSEVEHEVLRLVT